MNGLASASEVLGREFLAVRARILELAAALDRIDRAAGDVSQDPRMLQVHAALRVLDDSGTARAEHVQMAFSRPYDSNWRRLLSV